ncbi:glycoside hydrolase family 18 protein [Algoriphagus aquimarinus]|uniref:glycoside hydrolase family 18 protein n=1 Tax=Algoriphagus aquimarinus TaxID=237018 RepID=UPI0030D7FBA6
MLDFFRLPVSCFHKTVMVTAFLCLGCFHLWAQETISPAKLKLDSLSLKDSIDKSLLQRLIQPIRFKDNRETKERQRIFDFLKVLITENDLQIDSATVSEITEELIAQAKNIAVNQNANSALSDKNKLLAAEIQQALQVLDSKAPKSKIDSIQSQLQSVLQGMMNETDKNGLAIQKEITSKLEELQKVQYSCESENVKVWEVDYQDSLRITYQKCLKTSVRVFGWQSSEKSAEYKSYNLNYISDLIIYGFEIGGKGEIKNSKQLDLLLNGGSIKLAIQAKKTVSLSIYSKSETELSQFLGNSYSQNAFLSTIKTLIKKYSIGGININFEKVKSSDQNKLTQFIASLNEELTSENPDFLLTMSLPAINVKSIITSVNNYEFSQLVSLIDYFLIDTDKLNVPSSKAPFSPSPLYTNPKVNRGSIEATMGFYSNGKIPISKLVMTLSYGGISWPVPDFLGNSKALRSGESLNFRTIQEDFVTGGDTTLNAVYGFDAEQTSPYYNYEKKGEFRQLWYEDGISLYLKAQWALGKGLGGVAIEGLGQDEGYTEMWDAIGASLVYVDSVVLKQELIKQKKLGVFQYLAIFQDDLEWASANDVYIEKSELGHEMYCEYKIFKEKLSGTKLSENSYYKRLVDKLMLSPDTTISLKEMILMSAGVSDVWSKRLDYNMFIDPYDNFLKDDLECACLVSRWDTYTGIFKIATLVIIGVFILIALFLIYMVIRVGDDWRYRGLFTVIAIGLGILCLISGFFTLFLNGNFTMFGVGSEAVALWFLLLILIFGISIGVLLNKVNNRRKLRSKDLP